MLELSRPSDSDLTVEPEYEELDWELVEMSLLCFMMDVREDLNTRHLEFSIQIPNKSIWLVAEHSVFLLPGVLTVLSPAGGPRALLPHPHHRGLGPVPGAGRVTRRPSAMRDITRHHTCEG